MSRLLYVKIKLEIIGSNFIIEDADMSIDLKKTDEEKYNTCEVTIYNLADDTYNLIKSKTTSVRVYVDIDGQGYVLFFQGDLRGAKKRKKTTKTKSGKARKTTAKQRYNEPSIQQKQDSSDIETILTFEDGIKNYYLSNHISKSYSGEITNKDILEDVLKQVKKNGVEISANIDDLSAKTYPNGKILQGSFKKVVQNLCSDGNCDCKINNNTLIIRNKDGSDSSYIYVLDSNNCPKPEAESDKKIKIIAPFIPNLNPLDYVKLNFKDYQGVYKVKSVSSQIDNFGEKYETEVIVLDK